jgi:hypothetical protein
MLNLPVRTFRIIAIAALVGLLGCSKPPAVPTKPANNDVIQVPTVMPEGDPNNPKGKPSPTPMPKGATGMVPPRGGLSGSGMGPPAGMPGSK